MPLPVSSLLQRLRRSFSSSPLVKSVQHAARKQGFGQGRRRAATQALSIECYEPRLVLSANPAHDLIQLDQLRNDPLFSEVDGETGTGSEQISVVVIDTGLDGSHRDLVGNFVAYVDFVDEWPWHPCGRHGGGL